MNPEKLNESNAQTSLAFLDSVDAVGTCGEKRIALDGTPPPAFLSILPDPDSPVIAPFSIKYDHNMATEADIGSHIVSYTVISVLYPSFVTSIAGTFTFTISCPD